MLEFTSTRHNPGIDPALHAWGWEIPLYLFVGGMVAGMMVFAGWAMLRLARGEDPKSFFSIQTPLLGFMALNVGMVALLLDLSHPLYAWALFITFEPLSPMSWGSWVLLVVYAILMVSALVRLPESWPWLGERVPVLRQASDWFTSSPSRLRVLGVANIAFGIGLGIYTGILLNTMVARPLWNTSILPLLFLVSGLSAAAAALHLAHVVFPGRPAPRGLIGGAFAVMTQPLGGESPAKHTVNGLIRADVVLLAVEFVVIALMLLSLATSTLSHIEAAKLLFSGKFGLIFWVGVIAVGIVVPIVMQLLELSHRIPHTVVPAILVLVGGYSLRWVMVNAGQASSIVSVAAGGG